MLNRIALITGGSRGIGAAIANELALNDYTVAINYDKNIEQAHKTKEKCLKHGVNAEIFQADVSNSLEVRKMLSAINTAFGEVDLLVNNAGISLFGLITEHTDEQIERLIGVNLIGTINCARAVLPDMIKNKFGSIINISSMWGEVGASCEVAYSATKSAVIGFTKALAKEVAPSGIRVNCISPGVIQTDMNSSLSCDDYEALKSETPLGRIGLPQEIAKSVTFLSSENASFITGQVLGVNGGLII